MVSTSRTEGAGRLVGADRVLAVLLELGEHPDGISLGELAKRVGSPKSTVHRALGSLRRADLATLQARGVYRLGDEFMRLAFQNQTRRPEIARIEPVLRNLCDRFGETAHYAVLDGNEVVYRAKVDPPEGAVRLTSTIGGRNPAYRTAVGKLLLAYTVETDEELKALTGDRLEAKTPHTITSHDRLWGELKIIRDRGYATDEQENELGINCLALPVTVSSPTAVGGAISLSGLAFRTPLSDMVAAIAELREIVQTATISER